MDKNEGIKLLDESCKAVRSIHSTLDLHIFKIYVIGMFVSYMQAKEASATPLQIKKGFVPLPGEAEPIVVACVFISATFFECPVSYNDLYSIYHVDRDSIRKCERDIKQVLLL